jgi:hypothetical protein
VRFDGVVESLPLSEGRAPDLHFFLISTSNLGMVAMDMTGWSEVTDGNGDVVGWVAPGDVDTPLEAAHRRKVAGARAAAIDQAADLLMDECFDLEDSWAAAESVMPADAVDSAGNVVLVLRWIEQLRE